MTEGVNKRRNQRWKCSILRITALPSAAKWSARSTVNDVFSRAAALSPSIWVSPEKLSGLVGRAKLEPGTVLYMDYGSREMGNHDGMRKGFAEMCSKIMIRGIHLTSRLVPGGTHSEASWEKQLPFMIHTLMYELD